MPAIPPLSLLPSSYPNPLLWAACQSLEGGHWAGGVGDLRLYPLRPVPSAHWPRPLLHPMGWGVNPKAGNRCRTPLRQGPPCGQYSLPITIAHCPTFEPTPLIHHQFSAPHVQYTSHPPVHTQYKPLTDIEGWAPDGPCAKGGYPVDSPRDSSLMGPRGGKGCSGCPSVQSLGGVPATSKHASAPSGCVCDDPGTQVSTGCDTHTQSWPSSRSPMRPHRTAHATARLTL